MTEQEQATTVAQTPTVSHFLGEMVWILSQSPLHNALRISDLEWLIMSPLIHRQFYVFRDGDKPIGLALWARCSPQTVAKLDKGLLDEGSRLTLEDWQSGDDVWLVDMIAPFADAQNRHREIMFADLISGPLSGVPFSFHQTDPATGKRTVNKVGADVGAQLKEAVKSAFTND